VRTISQAVNSPLLAGPSSVVLCSVSVVSWLSRAVPCWQEEPGRVFCPRWAVPVLPRGSAQGFLPTGSAAVLFVVPEKVQAPTRASPAAGPVALGCGFLSVSRFSQAGSHFLACCPFSQTQLPLRS